MGIEFAVQPVPGEQHEQHAQRKLKADGAIACKTLPVLLHKDSRAVPALCSLRASMLDYHTPLLWVNRPVRWGSLTGRPTVLSWIWAPMGLVQWQLAAVLGERRKPDHAGPQQRRRPESVPLPIKELLKRALNVGALEVRLIPGRRTILVTGKGPSEVRGDQQTPESIREILKSIITPEARKHIAAGWAEWEFPLDDKGTVRATAEVKLGLFHVSFFLNSCGDAPEAETSQPAYELEPAPPRFEPREDYAALRPGSSSTLQGGGSPRVESTRDASRMAPIAISEAQPPLVTQPSIPPDRQAYDVGMSSASTKEIDELLMRMLEMKASDLHVSSHAPPMVRVDGSMLAVPGGQRMSPEQVQRMVWPIVPPRNREEFEKTHDTDFAYELPKLSRFRANVFVDLHGMGCVLRTIPSKVITASDLRLPESVLSFCTLPKGLVLVTGPTGSGKSTTLAALIDHINRTRNDHIITIEDPVEFVHSNNRCLVNQRQVGEHTLTFQAALRAALREDPDIVLLGEMRDLETVAIAIETAETGHLVFGTLHTSSAPSTVDRIIDQFPSGQQDQIRVMLANSLKGVVSQMLCKKRGGGRVAALEILFAVPAVANLIRERKIFQIPSIMQTGRNLGMRLMNDSLLELVTSGVVAPEEALAKAYDKAGLESALKQAGIRIAE